MSDQPEGIFQSIDVYSEDDGSVHVRVDRAGERAVSARIPDPRELIEQIADAAGLTVTIDGNA